MRMLIVDDHPGFRRFARAFLTSAGHEVVGECGTGEDALAQAARLNPDVVLLDIGLPGQDGIEVARSLATSARPPVVVLTSSRSAGDYGTRLEAAHAAGFVAKAELTRASLGAVLQGAGCGS